MAEAKIDLAEAERFENACKDYSQRIENAVAFLKNSVMRVGEHWNDSDYQTVFNMVADIEREVIGALTVANEQIIPYVSRKVEVLKAK